QQAPQSYGWVSIRPGPFCWCITFSWAQSFVVSASDSPVTRSSHWTIREPLVVRLERAVCRRRLVHLASAHVGRHWIQLENLVLRNGHEIPGQDQEIRELSGFDGALHVLFPGRKRIVVGGDAQRFRAADFLVRSEHASIAGLARHVVIERDERVVG